MATDSTLHGKVQTVRGLIDPAALGPTLMHEHLLIDLAPPNVPSTPELELDIDLCNCWKINYGQQPSLKNYRLNQVDVAIEEVADMVSAGGRSVVDLTCGGLKPNPLGLVEISEATGAHIVMGCGHYVEEYQDAANHQRSVDDFAGEIIAQLTVGAWGTDIRAGIIGEIGCQSPWTELERRVMQGALISQKETGAAVNVHPGRNPDQPMEVVDFIRSLGGDTSRLIISHIDRTIFDDDRLLRLADTGCVLEFDMFGWEHTSYPRGDIDIPNDGARLRMVRLLADRGYLNQILISHDICVRTRLGRYGGHGYQHIFANIVPRMLARSFTRKEIDTILVDTPARLLTFL